jgi:RNA recognition motif-containing protein
MIRNKNTGMNKDFAFVEFYSPEETTLAYKATNATELKIQG